MRLSDGESVRVSEGGALFVCVFRRLIDGWGMGIGRGRGKSHILEVRCEIENNERNAVYKAIEDSHIIYRKLRQKTF